MTIVGIHPEELFDKLLDGEITPSERERLRAHLDACMVCRFEYAARLDFQAEALALNAASQPPALPLRPLAMPLPSPGAVEDEPAGPRVVAAPIVARRRTRVVVWSLAAAALITASGAVASGLTGQAPWHVMALMFSPTAVPAEKTAPTLPKKTAVAAPIAAAADAVAAPAVAAPVVAAPAEPLVDVTTPAVEPTSAPQRAAGAHATEAAQLRAVSAVPTVLAAVAPSNAEMPSEPVAKEPTSAAKLFGEANQARRSGDIGRASGLYHLLQDQYAGSPEAELSRVTLALLLLDSGDAQGALSGFERYLAGSSRGLEAEALVGRARALGRLGRRDLETSAWQEVQRKYPHSIYGRQATERLLALGQP